MRNKGALSKIALAVLLASTAAPALAQSGSNNITIVLPEQPSNLEPCGSILTDVGQVLSQNITEPLTVINPKDGTPQPKLATKWERVNDTTWRFHLRDGVKFQDGKEFNAEAVAFTLKRMTGGAFTCNNLAKFGSAKLTVTPVDKLTVDIKTEKPEPILPALLSVAMMVSPATPADKAVNDPVGTGPYKLNTFTPQTVVLDRFDGYWGKTPDIAKAGDGPDRRGPVDPRHRDPGRDQSENRLLLPELGNHGDPDRYGAASPQRRSRPQGAEPRH
jgi:peptide/nickel transport system substrate-binding protein